MAVDLDNEEEAVALSFGGAAPTLRDVCEAVGKRLRGFTPGAIDVAWDAWWLEALADPSYPKSGVPKLKRGMPKMYVHPVERLWANRWLWKFGGTWEPHHAAPDVAHCRVAYNIIDNPFLRASWGRRQFVGCHVPERWRGEFDLALRRDTDNARYAKEVRTDLPEPPARK